MLTTAIKQGINPKDTYYDGTSPMTLDIPGGGTWEVNNDEPGGGTMSLEEATWNSINVVFAQLDLDVGPENVTQTAEEMGIEAPLQSVPAEAIGGLAYGVTPLEQADGYATLASGGVHHDPTAISKVEFPDGKVDEIESESGERVLSTGEAYDVTNILKGVISKGTGAGYTNLSYCSEVAGKTGTSEEESDAWFVGYTPEILDRGLGRPSPVTRNDRLRRPDRRPDLACLHGSGNRRRMPRLRNPDQPPELSALTGGHTAAGGRSAHFGEEEENSVKKKAKKTKEEGPRSRRRRRRRRRNRRRSAGRRSRPRRNDPAPSRRRHVPG